MRRAARRVSAASEEKSDGRAGIPLNPFPVAWYPTFHPAGRPLPPAPPSHDPNACPGPARPGRAARGRRAVVRGGRVPDPQGVLLRVPRRGGEAQGRARPAPGPLHRQGRRHRPGRGRGQAGRQPPARARGRRRDAAGQEEAVRGRDRRAQALDRGRGHGGRPGAGGARRRLPPHRRRPRPLGLPARQPGRRSPTSAPRQPRRCLPAGQAPREGPRLRAGGRPAHAAPPRSPST